MSEVAPSDAQRRNRVAVLNTHPIQYFAPLYRKIVETCPDIDLTVLYLSDSSLRGESDPGFAQQVVWDIDLMSGYQHKFVGKSYGKASPSGFWSLATPAIWTEIRHGGYDLLWLHGYAYAANLLALARNRYWWIWSYLIVSTGIWLVVMAAGIIGAFAILDPRRTSVTFLSISFLVSLAIAPVVEAVERRLCANWVLGLIARRPQSKPASGTVAASERRNRAA